MPEIAELSRAATGLGIVLLLLVAVFWLLRRLGPIENRGRFAQGRRLAVIENLPLDPRTRLVLVRHDRHEHLVLLSSQGARLVTRSDISEPADIGQASIDRAHLP